MMGLVQEFKDFALKGNFVDMAVGIVIGAGFGKIVSMFVEKIIMPSVGLLGSVDFSKYDIQLKDAVTTVVEGKEVTQEAISLGVGSFMTALIEFTIVALAIFIVIKMLNTAKKRFAAEEAAAPAAPSEDILLLREIRDSLAK
jgi:large conductance mechanosensitive channel